MTAARLLCAAFFSSVPMLRCSLSWRSGSRAWCSAAVCAGLAAVGVGYLAVVLWVVPRTAQQRTYPVEAVKDASGEVAGYLATYVVPFVAVPSPSAADVIGYCILALVVLVIFMRSDLRRSIRRFTC